MRNIREITSLAQKVASAFTNQKEYFTSQLAKKASDLALLYPQDSTTASIATVLNKKAAKEMYITSDDIKYIYSKFETQGNKFASAFKSELGIRDYSDVVKEAAEKKKKEEEIAKEVEAVESHKPDATLVSALESLITKKKVVKAPSAKVEAAAIACVKECMERELPEMKCSVDIDAHSSSVVIAKVKFNTPKGASYLYVPMEVIGGSHCVCIGSFLGNDGVQDLTKKELTAAIKKSVGKPNKYTGKLLISILDALSEKTDKKITQADMYYIKKKFATDNPTFTSDAFIDQSGKSFFAEEKFLPQPKFAGSEKFSEKLSSVSAQAELQFSKAKIVEAQLAVNKSLVEVGQRPSSIKVAGYNREGIEFSVALASGQVIDINVDLQNKPLVAPQFKCAHTKWAWTRDSFDKIASKSVDPVSIATHSPLFAQNAEDVIKIIASSVRDGDMKRAGEALGVIRARHPELSAVAFQTYTNALMPDTAPKCSRMIRRASSMYPICGHTGLPIKDTYIDESGSCRPLHRRTQGV